MPELFAGESDVTLNDSSPTGNNVTENGNKILNRKTVSIMSPLRYPGAKRRFADYVSETLRVNNIKPKLFVEPFAGGASVALRVLNDNLVEKVALADIDPLVAGFWDCTFNHTDWLIDQITKIDVTLDKWHFYKSFKPTTVFGNAIACIYLNRTSWSGLLTENVGPIGGRHQSSEYKVDCRFPKATLIKRINQAARLKDRIEFVSNADWKSALASSLKRGYAPDEVFAYCDPPFYHKASELYRFYFREDDHRALHDYLLGAKFKWLLSYDAAEEIKALYSDADPPPRCVELLYTAAPKAQMQVKEIVVSNLPSLPHHDRLWQTSSEWGKGNDIIEGRLSFEETME